MEQTSKLKIVGITDATLRQRTRRTWTEWLDRLDRDGAKTMSHKEIAALVAKKYKLSGWWSQMVTVGYEQARGLRNGHEKPAGFEISKSKTLPASVQRVFAAWRDDGQRATWLGERSTVVRTAAARKSMRLTWIDGTQILAVNFYPKNAARCQVTVEHTKLRDAEEAERMKAWWGEALVRLKSHLES